MIRPQQLLDAYLSLLVAKLNQHHCHRPNILYRQPRRAPAPEPFGYIPQSILDQTGRGYLVTVGRQINGCYAQGRFDACAVMIRRLVDIAIIEAFEVQSRLAEKIKDVDGNYLMLSDLVDKTMAEPAWALPRNTKRHLPQLKSIGHMSAHGRYFHARREDMDRLQDGCRVIVVEFLHHAGLQ